jgi:uncharacterized protein YbgA (DUF1722 family)
LTTKVQCFAPLSAHQITIEKFLSSMKANKSTSLDELAAEYEEDLYSLLSDTASGTIYCCDFFNSLCDLILFV